MPHRGARPGQQRWLGRSGRLPDPGPVPTMANHLCPRARRSAAPEDRRRLASRGVAPRRLRRWQTGGGPEAPTPGPPPAWMLGRRDPAARARRGPARDRDRLSVGPRGRRRHDGRPAEPSCRHGARPTASLLGGVAGSARIVLAARGVRGSRRIVTSAPRRRPGGAVRRRPGSRGSETSSSSLAPTASCRAQAPATAPRLRRSRGPEGWARVTNAPAIASPRSGAFRPMAARRDRANSGDPREGRGAPRRGRARAR